MGGSVHLSPPTCSRAIPTLYDNGWYDHIQHPNFPSVLLLHPLQAKQGTSPCSLIASDSPLLYLAAPQRPRVWGIQDDLHLGQKGSLLRTLDDRAETSTIMANQVPQKRARGQAESQGEQRAEHWGLFLDLALNGSPRQCFRSTSPREKHSHPSLNIEPQGSQ